MERAREFNLQTNCITSYFLYHLQKIDTDRFKKVLIRLIPSNLQIEPGESTIKPLMDIVEIEKEFDYNGYWKSEKKKEVLLDITHKEMIRAAEKFDWNTEKIHAAKEAIISSSLDFVVDVKKEVSSPNRKYTAQIRLYYGMKQADLICVFREKATGVESESKFISTEPHEHCFHQYLGKIKWLSNTEVELQPKASITGQTIEPIRVELLLKNPPETHE